MSTFPEPMPNEPENSLAGEDVAPPSTDPLAPENIPAPPAEWTGEPEEPSPSADLVAPAIIGALPDRPKSSSVNRHLRRSTAATHVPSAKNAFRISATSHYLGLLDPFRLDRHHDARSARPALPSLWHHQSRRGRYRLSLRARQPGSAVLHHLRRMPHRLPHHLAQTLLRWNSLARRRQRSAAAGRLISAAVVCFFVAMINGMLMPGPTNAPIDELFKAPGAAWVLFAFGVTLAPFFEEMAFRGFLASRALHCLRLVLSNTSPARPGVRSTRTTTRSGRFPQ